MPRDGVGDACAGVAVAVGIDGLRHAAVGVRLLEQLARVADDRVVFDAREPHRAGCDGLRALRLAAQHQDGFAEGGRLLLQAAGIRHHEMAARHQVVHLLDVDRVDEMDARHAAQLLLRAGADGGAEVDGIDDLDTGMGHDDMAHGAQDVVHRLTVVLAAVAGQHDDAAVFKVQRVERRVGKAEIVAHGGAHRVDDGVAGDKDLAAHGLPAQILGVGGGGGEVQRGDVPDEGAVHLLREGGVFVIGAQAGLDVTDGDLVVKRRKRAGEGRRGVAVDEHQVRLCLLQHRLHAQKRTRRDGREGLLLLHDVEVVVGVQAEDLHHGVEHLAVLTGQAAQALEALARGKRLHQRRHLDRLRARAEDGHDLNSLHACPPAQARRWVPRTAVRASFPPARAFCGACRRSGRRRWRRRPGSRR